MNENYQFKMESIYAGEKFPEIICKSIYLAGPSPRSKDALNWRNEALSILNSLKYDGIVFIPLPRNNEIPKDYDAQAKWEQEAMDRSDVILFWIPRDLQQLPGFSTNVEFGQKLKNKNIVLGYPQEAPKMRFLDYLAKENFVTIKNSLSETISYLISKIGDGAIRKGGECQIPLFLWNLPHFQSWLQSQKKVGNRLDGAKVELTFGVGKEKSFILYWAIHVDIYVSSENRNKSNEIVIGRPDIKHVVAFERNDNLLDTKIILIKEFRSTANTDDGYIHEVPGGSGFKKENPKETAVKEFFEETGIVIDSERLKFLPPRQLAGTTTTHHAHCFIVELTREEMQKVENNTNKAHGNLQESEITYLEVRTLKELLSSGITDWANMGMIFNAIFS